MIEASDHEYASQIDVMHAHFNDTLVYHKVLRPASLFRVAQPPGDLSDPATPDLVIQRMLSRGSTLIDFGTGRRHRWFCPNDILVNPPQYANVTISDHWHRVQALSIPYSHLRALAPCADLNDDGHFGALHDGVPSIDLVAFLDRVDRVDANDPLAVEESLLSLAHSLGKARLRSTAAGPAERLAPRVLARAIAWLEGAEPSAPLAEIAGECRLSSYHFCRAFKATTGVPPHRWRIVHRIERARALLGSTRLAIGDIANAVGYDDVAYFSRIFAKETGCSPRTWRSEAFR